MLQHYWSSEELDYSCLQAEMLHHQTSFMNEMLEHLATFQTSWPGHIPADMPEDLDEFHPSNQKHRSTSAP
jgi:hypothetical protein